MRPSVDISNFYNKYYHVDTPDMNITMTHSEYDALKEIRLAFGEEAYNEAKARVNARLADPEIKKVFPPLSPTQLKISRKKGQRWEPHLSDEKKEFFNDVNAPSWLRKYE